MKIIKQSALLVLILVHVASLVNALDTSKILKSDHNQDYYIEIENKVNWFDALTSCAERNMTLLTMESPEKNNEINRLIMKTYGKNVQLWIGGHRMDTSHKFYWIATGRPFFYTFWSPNQPDFYYQAEYCAQMGWDAQMRWNDHRCDTKCGYICEYQIKQECHCNGNDRQNKYGNISLQFYNHG